jgi:hypothetical protein
VIAATADVIFIGSVVARFVPGGVSAAVAIFPIYHADTFNFVAFSILRSFGVVVCLAWAFEFRCFLIAAVRIYYIVSFASVLAYT